MAMDGLQEEDGCTHGIADGQTAVVTGGAQGMGFAIAERFVAEGARVVLGDSNLDATAGRRAEARRPTTSRARCAAT